MGLCGLHFTRRHTGRCSSLWACLFWGCPHASTCKFPGGSLQAGKLFHRCHVGISKPGSDVRGRLAEQQLSHQADFHRISISVFVREDHQLHQFLPGRQCRICLPAAEMLSRVPVWHYWPWGERTRVGAFPLGHRLEWRRSFGLTRMIFVRIRHQAGGRWCCMSLSTTLWCSVSGIGLRLEEPSVCCLGRELW